MSHKSEVSEFYKDKTLFLTGGTGFMGKVFIEKLLYCCPDIKKIYVLLRPKRGKSIEARLEDIFKTPLFSRIRDECPTVLSKVVPVSGDVSLSGLGLSPFDEERLLQEVEIAVHGAASLRLEAKLKDAINMNTEGTLRFLTVCKKMKKLLLVVHVSTAFCHCDVEEMEEKAYPSPYDPMDVIKMTHWLPDSTLEKITPDLLKPHPNSYTYSKRLAETLVASHYPELPVCIVRPSIVIPAWKEPLEGWVDNLNGPTGILVGGAKGVIRSMHCNADYNAEVIPVDMAINGIITAIYRLASNVERPKEIPVLNLTQGKTYPMTWGKIVERGKEIAWNYPFEMMLWYPNGTIYSNKLLHDLSTIFFHWLPAYVIDFLMFVFGQKRFMLRVQRKIQDGLDVLQYFTTREWKFKNEKLLELRASLNPIDRERYFLDFEKIDMESYLTNTILGARHYLMKEDPKSLPRCRVILKILYILDKLVSFGFYFLLAWIVVSSSDKASAALDSVISVAQSALPFIRNVHHN